MSVNSVRERRSRSLRLWLGPSLACMALAGLHFFRFALTPSLPRGLYLALPAEGPYHHGDVVSFCPSQALGRLLLDRHLVAPGLCPAGSVPLAKRIAAVSPYACASAKGLWLDSQLFPWPVLPASLPLVRYAGCGPTASDCAFLLGDSADSIDSRIFGCVSLRRFRNRLIPVLTERRPS